MSLRIHIEFLLGNNMNYWNFSPKSYQYQRDWEDFVLCEVTGSGDGGRRQVEEVTQFHDCTWERRDV